MPILYSYGFHDAGGEYLFANKPGYLVITEAIGCDLNDHSGHDYRDLANRGFCVIVRLNNAYSPDGTIPEPEHYADFARRCANFIAASQGCNIWIIGNETNAVIERPQGKAILPVMYADCYNRCYAAIKGVVPTAQVITAAVAPWDNSTKYTGNDNGDWVIYLRDILVAIPHCDGLAIHIYSHGASPSLIVSEATMDPPFQNRRYEFRAYLDFLAAVPVDKRNLPVYATETDQYDDWVDANTGWVQAAYAEIDHHNNTAGAQKIVCLALFRWQVFKGEKWSISNKQGVQADFRAAVARGYRSPDALIANGANQMQTFIPAVHSDNPTSLPAPSLPSRDVDPRAAARGTQIQTIDVAPGQQFWRVKRLYTPDNAGSKQLGPDHHILANVLVDGQRQVGTPLLVTWGGGGLNEQAAIQTKKNDPFAYSADFPLSPGPFTLVVNDGKPSEKVVGIEMGEQTEQGFNPGIHESTLVDFELVTMPAESQPQPGPATGTKTATGYVIEPAGAYIRSEPIDGDIVDAVPFGDAVTITGYNADHSWSQVEYNGASGWMSSALIGPEKPALAKPSPTQPPAPAGDNWSRIRAFLHQWEGGLQKLQWDAGNWTGCKVGAGELKGTNFGISACGYPDLDIEHLTQEQADNIFYSDMYLALGIDKQPWPLDLLMMNAAVNFPKTNATAWLQQSGGDPLLFFALMLRGYRHSEAWPQAGNAWVDRMIDLAVKAKQA